MKYHGCFPVILRLLMLLIQGCGWPAYLPDLLRSSRPDENCGYIQGKSSHLIFILGMVYLISCSYVSEISKSSTISEDSARACKIVELGVHLCYRTP